MRPGGGKGALQSRSRGTALDRRGRAGSARQVRWRALLVLAAAALGAATARAETAPRFAALVFSKTAGYRHASIEPGIAAIEAPGAEHGFAVDATEDGGQFTDERLARYKVVVFLSTTGDVLDAAQKAAFERYIRAGG